MYTRYDNSVECAKRSANTYHFVDKAGNTHTGSFRCTSDAVNYARKHGYQMSTHSSELVRRHW